MNQQQQHRSHLDNPPEPLLIGSTLHLREFSKKVQFVDHAAQYNGQTDEEMIKNNGGKMPWDHHLKSASFLEQRAPAQIEKEWLEPKNKPQLGMTGKVREDFDTLDLKWLNPVNAPTNDEELMEFNAEKKRRAKAAYAWGHEDAVMSCAFSPDGIYIASVGCDGRCCIWEYESAKCLRNLSRKCTRFHCIGGFWSPLTFPFSLFSILYMYPHRPRPMGIVRHLVRGPEFVGHVGRGFLRENMANVRLGEDQRIAKRTYKVVQHCSIFTTRVGTRIG